MDLPGVTNSPINSQAYGSSSSDVTTQNGTTVNNKPSTNQEGLTDKPESHCSCNESKPNSILDTLLGSLKALFMSPVGILLSSISNGSPQGKEPQHQNQS